MPGEVIVQMRRSPSGGIADSSADPTSADVLAVYGMLGW